MAKKTYVVDTNVLLADPNALFSFEENTLILPFVVLEELDKFKSRQDEIGANSREVVRELSKLSKGSPKQGLKNGAKLESGGTIKVVSSSDYEVTLNEELQGDKNDNFILKVCLGNKRSILVTNDILLRIKANSCGVRSEEYKKFSVAESPNKLYSGIREKEIQTGEFGELWNSRKNKEALSTAVEQIEPGLFPNEFAHFASKDGGEFVARRLNEEQVRGVKDHYELRKVKPRNAEQNMAIDLLMDEQVKLVTIVGKAGTGKTLLALASGLDQVVDRRQYDTLLVCRPVHPLGKDIGFLPGSKEEKMEPWISPIKDNLRFLLTSDGSKKTKDSENTLGYYFDRGIIEVEAMTYIRGRSISNAFIIIDEAQNLTAHELKTIITRVGEGTKIVLTGDIDQIDNIYVDSVSNGLSVAVERFKENEIAGHVFLKTGERSELATIAAKIL